MIKALYTILTLSAGASLGASLRYGIYRLDARWVHNAFLTTLFINALGSFAIGWAIIYLSHHANVRLQLFLIPGLLASFTTFSTFSLEALTLIKQGLTLQAMGYLMMHVILGVSFCAIGVKIGEMFIAK